MPPAGFRGLRVVAFESRHTGAMERLILGYEGSPLVVPTLREVPLEENEEVLAFADELWAGRIDLVIFLTGVGTRALTKVVESKYTRAQWVEALSRVTIAARGPKSVAALWELGVPIHITAPEPNTWREVLSALDSQKETLALEGCRVAVQEYGVPNHELLDGLTARGAAVRRVPVYQWKLPADTAPLREAIAFIAAGKTDVALFTTSVQLIHLLALAKELDCEAAVRQAFSRMIIGSIGPTTSETLTEHGVTVDLEPAHSKMAALVKEAAERSHELLSRKRSQGAKEPRSREAAKPKRQGAETPR